MLASISKKYVLLMNPKTGTTTLNKAFARSAEVKVGGSPALKHFNYRGYRRLFGNYFDKIGADVFVVVRPPLELLYSWYRYRSRSEISDPTHKRFSNYVGDMSFIDFVEQWEVREKGPCNVGSGIDFFCDRDNRVPVEVKIVDYKDFNLLHQEISSREGIKRDPEKRLNVSPIGSAKDSDMNKVLEKVSEFPRLKDELNRHSELSFYKF